MLAIKAIQKKQDLPTTFKEVISVNCGMYCNINGGVVDMSHQFLQSSLLLPSVKESSLCLDKTKLSLILKLLKHITLSISSAGVEKFSELEKKFCAQNYLRGQKT